MFVLKKWKKWLVGICTGLIAVIIFVLIWQWENIQAFKEAVTYTKDEIKIKINKNKEDTKDALEAYDLGEIRDLTLEEEEELIKGELSVEDAIERIINNGDESKAVVNNNDELKTQNKVVLSPKEKKYEPIEQTKPYSTIVPSDNLNKDKIVEKYVSQMYILQATYISKLGNVESRAREAYANLPKEEHNLIGAQKLAPQFINEGLSLERQCDNEVEAVLVAMETELKKIGEDTSIIATMKATYETQKRLKKSYYLSSIK